MLACHQPPCPFLFLVRKTGFWPRLPRSLGRQGVFLSWQSAHGSMMRAEHSGTRHTKVLPMASEPQLPQRVQERMLLLQLIAPAPSSAAGPPGLPSHTALCFPLLNASSGAGIQCLAPTRNDFYLLGNFS